MGDTGDNVLGAFSDRSSLIYAHRLQAGQGRPSGSTGSSTFTMSSRVGGVVDEEEEEQEVEAPSSARG